MTVEGRSADWEDVPQDGTDYGRPARDRDGRDSAEHRDGTRMNKDGVCRGATLGSVANAARVLKSFGPNDREWGVSDLARQLDIAKSTAHRLLATLTDEGPAGAGSRQTGRYRLGLAVFDLAAAAQSTDLHEAVALADDRAAQPHRRDGAGRRARRPRRRLRRAARQPQHASTLPRGRPPQLRPLHRVRQGDCSPSSAPSSSIGSSPDGTSEPKTPHTITDVDDAADASSTETRRRGYSVNRRESEVGVMSVAAPIRDARPARTVAAISVAGPAERLEPHEFAVAQVTMEVAAAVSRRLGYRGSIGAA